jgi:hypothetical protein
MRFDKETREAAVEWMGRSAVYLVTLTKAWGLLHIEGGWLMAVLVVTAIAWRECLVARKLRDLSWWEREGASHEPVDASGGL